MLLWLKGIKLKNVKCCGISDIFKLVISNYCIVQEIIYTSVRKQTFSSSSQYIYNKKKSGFAVHGWKPCWNLHSGCSFTKNESLVPGWWLTCTQLWKHACVCGSPWWPEIWCLSYQSVLSLDTSRENVLFSHSNNCMSLSLFASSQLKHRPYVSQNREDEDLALSCHLACWPEF